jgi:hypothetical protein
MPALIIRAESSALSSFGCQSGKSLYPLAIMIRVGCSRRL